MRGKHGNAAQNRRARVELEQRAEKAERMVERLQGELDTLKSTSQSQIESLRGELARVRKDRDAAAAPALKQAEERIRTLMAERDEAIRKYEKVLKQWQRLTLNLMNVLKGMGLGPGEAIESIIAAIEPDGHTPTVIAPGARHRSDMPVEYALTLGQAQGWRGGVDRLADRRIRSDEPDSQSV